MAKWQILICGVMERLPLSGHRIDRLYRQIQGRDVDILMCIDDYQMNISEKRNHLLSLTTAEYVCFVDDDDEVATNYVDRIYPLLDGVDYIGFKVAHFDRGKRTKPVRHSLEYAGWSEDANGFYRNISHLNPIKTELAKQVPFEGTFSEDERWANKLQGLVKTQHFIDQEMYFYYSDPDKSVALKRKDKI